MGRGSDDHQCCSVIQLFLSTGRARWVRLADTIVGILVATTEADTTDAPAPPRRGSAGHDLEHGGDGRRRVRTDRPRVAVVSGGGTGIGKAIAAGLAADGFLVVILGRRAEVLAEAADALNVGSGTDRVTWRQADLTAPEAVQTLADELTGTYGTVDALVNNAGGTAGSGAEDLLSVAAAWRSAYDQNVVSAVLLTHALLPLLRRPGGRIVLIGSMTSRTGGGAAPYGAAKAALNGWVVSLSAAHTADGITANVVLPGYVPGTGLGGGFEMPQEMHDRVVSRIAAGRAGRPEDAAALVRFLVTEDAGFLTGQVIEVNGGTLPPNR